MLQSNSIALHLMANRLTSPPDAEQEDEQMSVEEQQRSRTHRTGLTVRPLEPDDVETADAIMRIAFGSFLGAPEPIQVFGDAQWVRPRYAAAPEWAFAAELDGELVGSNFATRWGSYGFFGPLTVRPEYWGRGIGSALMEPIIDLFAQWQVRQAGLFTFPQSPMHIGLYQKFGFWPQQLTPVLEKTIAPGAATNAPLTYATLAEPDRASAIDACRALTEAVYPGLDLSHEIEATYAQALGDTLLLEETGGLAGFAVCHLGAGEAGSGTCFAKFAAVQPGASAAARFEQLLDGCEALAAASGLGRVVAGVNTARYHAYRHLLDRGYRAWLEGVLMQRPNNSGYNRPDLYILDDLR
jgi:GNAT superfamily N-acetyltransferase